MFGSILGGLFNLGQAIFDRTRLGYETSPQKRAFNDSVRHEQKIFERDSKYNSPAEQMKRFDEAGLNPNLIYGQGTPGITSGSNVQASGNVERLDVMSRIMESVAFNKEMDLKDATIEQVRANTRLIEERAGSEDWKQLRLEQDWMYLEQNYPELMDKLRRENRIGTQTELFKVSTEESKSEMAKTAEEIARMTKDAKIETEQRENRIGSRTEDARVQTSQAQSILLSHKIQTELMRQGLMERDGKIKNEVLRGKQFQNAILEMQKKFLTEGTMNPQMFWQAFLNIIGGALK